MSVLGKVMLPSVQGYDPSAQGYDSKITTKMSIEYLDLDVIQ